MVRMYQVLIFISFSTFHLQKRRHQPHHTLCSLTIPRALHPVLQEYLYAVALILEEDFAHLKRCFCVIDEGIHLKVMFKTAKIHIRGAYRGQLIIRNHRAGVQGSPSYVRQT